MINFWQNLKKPFYALAPMAGITDSAFRQVCAGFGADVLYSEMASAAALFYAKDKTNDLSDLETMKLLEFAESERPYVVQLFGSVPEHFATAARIVEENLKPDGIDINFGCPVKKVQKQGAGAILMKDPKLAYRIIQAVIENCDLPVSIKIRSAVGESGALRFLDHLSGLDIKAVMIHGRTLGQMFSGEIDTYLIKEARNYFGGTIIANGGINNAVEAKIILEATKAEGLGIARGALGKPWIFAELKKGISQERTKSEIIETILNHANLMLDLKGESGILEMRKHLCWYVSGFSGARKLRAELIKVENMDDIDEALRNYVR